jgi:hypothetical protein
MPADEYNSLKLLRSPESYRDYRPGYRVSFTVKLM